MQTTFAEIDDRVSEACAQELKSPSVSRDGLKSAATKVIAGFHLYDKAEEDRLFEQAIGARRRQVESFQEKRAEIAGICTKLGVVPLAVLPTPSWRQICNATELFRLVPDAHGMVAYDQTKFRSLKRSVRASVEAQLEYAAKHDWKAFLKMMFPRFESIEVDWRFALGFHNGILPEYRTLPAAQQESWRYMAEGSGRACFATLVLPTPPADFATTLVKVQSLALKVAAVADAIAFKETPSQLYNKVRAAQEAEERRLREDPIIYTEHGSATAILAQFGDFPIEKQVVERVIRADRLFRHFPAEQINSTDWTGQ